LISERVLAGLLLAAGCFIGCSAPPPAPVEEAGGPPVLRWSAAVTTEQVGDDPDDPAIWVHPTDPAQSLIVATNKVAAPGGALVVYDLAGKIVQTISGLDRPNNVDIRQGVLAGPEPVDVAVVTERYRSMLRIYRIDPATRSLTELPPAGGIRVFEGEQGEHAAPMGIALYKRPADAALFAVVGRAEGPTQGYLWQYRLERNAAGNVVAAPVRKFGTFSGNGEIEALLVDDALGYVYGADELAGIRKYHADPDHPDAARELAVFGTTGYQSDREGLGIYSTGDGVGYLVSTDQIDGGSRYILYRREGAPGNPHDHSEVVAVIEGGADATDGIEVTSLALGPSFPHGLLVAMNSVPKNFLVFAWPSTGLP
jgi:3-phytase